MDARWSSALLLLSIWSQHDWHSTRRLSGGVEFSPPLFYHTLPESFTFLASYTERGQCSLPMTSCLSFQGAARHLCSTCHLLSLQSMLSMLCQMEVPVGRGFREESLTVTSPALSYPSSHHGN